ncbi:ankyrin repeat protein nuc-2 [Zalerion maritima]|uniref:Ankyrin repeat protein nuc-2 n=1 Tax=Zalerion maritima TaxID=339359 RepID=A0AAD5RZB9_9PEZI|nr:ankyrin repeat protein nuc-2 [Zalerion maritima]
MDPGLKFGKQIQKRQLEVPEYAASFVNYKALKKLIKRLSATPNLTAQNDPHHPGTPIDSEAALQANKAAFFFQVERELEKVNAFYLQKEAELKIRLKTLLDKKKVLQSRNQRISRRSAKFTTLEEGFQQFANDVNKLQQFVEINGTAFSKILKKWDKTSKSKTKELYLSRAVEVQPFFNAPVIRELSDQATTCLQELGALADGDQVMFDDTPTHVVSSQLGTEERDADTLLLDTVLSGNIDSLRDLLFRVKASLELTEGVEAVLQERLTRTFLASISQGPRESLQLLLDTQLVDISSEDDINHRNCLHQASIYGNIFVLQVGLSQGVPVSRQDVYGRIPLHYSSMHGHLDMLEALLKADEATIQLKDHDNFTPLIHAIIHGHLHCVERLLEKNAVVDPLSDTDHAPLNLACEHGSVEIVELLLKHGARIGTDTEGLYPQHLVARSGQTPKLLHLLQRYGADLNQVDKLYGWTPLVHAASEGNVPCLKELLLAGVDPNIYDEKGVRALYYAAWEGHIECMKLLVPLHHQRLASPRTGAAAGNTAQLTPMNSNTPAPMMLDGGDSIPDLILPPPIIPIQRYGHNFLESKTVVEISFEEERGCPPLLFFHNSKYPAARLTVSSKASDLIPKNIILPFQEDTREVTFQIDSLDSFTLDLDVYPTYGAKIIAKTVALPNTFKAVLSSSGHCCLPLFDPRLRAIGQINFHTQVIKPFQGQALELTNFETYWKETSQLEANPSTFVTGSSLTGDFVQVFVQLTNDGVPVLWPRWTVLCGEIEIPVSRLSYEQFSKMTARVHGRNLPESLPADNIGEIHRMLATSGISLDDALARLPLGININIQAIYPSQEEEQALKLGPTPDLNLAVDSILEVVFSHARRQRQVSPHNVRSVVFSSYNPAMCTALNWKQPNFPVFLCNDLGQDELMPPPSVIKSSGRRTLSIKKANMIPALGEAIKSHGLVLVVDKTTDQPPPEASPLSDPFPRLPKSVDGILKRNGVLRFSDSIDM